jgi:hypothetical protein
VSRPDRPALAPAGLSGKRAEPGKLALDPRVVAEARRLAALAALAAEQVIEMARTHTTVSVERALAASWPRRCWPRPGRTRAGRWSWSRRSALRT